MRVMAEAQYLSQTLGLLTARAFTKLSFNWKFETD